MDATPEIEARRQEAEREVRRGNFQAAITLYEGLVAEVPEDDRLAVRLDTLRTLLQPLELTHPKAAAGARAASAENDAQAGEAAANAGDLRAAVAAYERACATAPANALLAERLEELRAVAVARGIPVDAPRPRRLRSRRRQRRSRQRRWLRRQSLRPRRRPSPPTRSPASRHSSRASSGAAEPAPAPAFRPRGYDGRHLFATRTPVTLRPA